MFSLRVGVSGKNEQGSGSQAEKRVYCAVPLLPYFIHLF